MTSCYYTMIIAKDVQSLMKVGATKAELDIEVCRLFKVDLNHFFLQSWDAAFGGAYVDIKSNEILSSGQRIKVQNVVKIIPVQQLQLLNCSDTAVNSAKNDQAERNVRSEDEPEYGDMEDVVNMEEDGDLIDDEFPADVDMVNKENHMVSDGNRKQTFGSSSSKVPKPSSSGCWINNFKWPDIPLQIRKKLEGGAADLKMAERGTILEMVFYHVKPYTVYPTSTQYRRMIEELFQLYPSLVSPRNNLTCGDVKKLWLARLKYKFQNLRKNLKDEIPEIKKKGKTSKVAQPKTDIRAPPQWGITNYLPIQAESEDSETVEKHIEWLKTEATKKYPDVKRVQLAMSATLAARRQWIVRQHASVQEVQNQYPWIFKEEQQMEEMNRLCGCEDKFDNRLKSSLKKYGMPLVKYGLKLKTKRIPQCFKDAADLISSHRTVELREDAIATAALLIIPSLFRENMDSFFKVGDDGSPYLDIGDGNPLDSTEFGIMVDGIKLTTCTSFKSAVNHLVAVIYIFSIINPRVLSKTFLFIEKVLLGLEDDQPVAKVLLTAIAKLNALM